MSKFTAVVSNYAPRGSHNLQVLLGQIRQYFDQIIVVINDDSASEVASWEHNEINYLRRPNSGMNIGGWSEAIELCQDGHIVIFLQDECRLVNPSFLERYGSMFENSTTGMLVESLNPKWAFAWEEIAASGLNYPIRLPDGSVTTRVHYYKECMRNWGVAPGADGSHGRALTWAFRSEILKRIRRFPIGRTKEECIAAEICVSKMVQQLGYKVCQSDLQPFAFFEHVEWRKDGWSKK